MSARFVLSIAFYVALTFPSMAETEAERLIAKANLGSTEAQFELGQAYRDGYRSFSDSSTIRKNLDEAERWFTIASKKSVYAKAYLSGLYSSDDFDRRDYTKAAVILTEILHSDPADAGFVTGIQYSLGTLLFQECPGYLISLSCGTHKTSPVKNDQAAAAWFRKAADKGHAKAQFDLASMYEKGSGVPQDFTEAARLYQAAAESGEEEAPVMLGELYLRMQDRPRAYMWFNIGATDNRPQAAERRDRLADRMSPNAILEGQRLSREYLTSRKKPARGCAWGAC